MAAASEMKNLAQDRNKAGTHDSLSTQGRLPSDQWCDPKVFDLEIVWKLLWRIPYHVDGTVLGLSLAKFA